MTTQSLPPADLPTWKLIWRLVRFQPLPFLFNNLSQVAMMLANVVPGLVSREFFNLLSHQAPAGFNFWTLLAFTRVFLKDPGLVILDEASSRLDPATEQLIEHAVDRLLVGRTGLIIAHRLDTVHRADHILILEGGQISEYGAYQALRQDPASRFSRLLQTGLEEVLV